MSEIKEYKCPSCGAPMYYDIDNKSMSCRFCNNTFDLNYIRTHFNEESDDKLSDFDWVERTKIVWEPYEVEKLEEFDCSSCGGKIITWSSTATAKCPYCQHDVIVSSDFEGDIRPDKVIPFEVTAEEFKKKYTEHINGLKYIPKEFKDKAVLENIKGFYVPVWSYSCTCKSSFSVDNESYSGTVKLKNYPILANETNIRKDVFYSVWPFEFSKAEEFTASCLTGFYASRYNIGAESVMNNANPEVKRICSVRASSKAQSLYEPVDYNSIYVREAHKNANISDRELTYYLVPIWLLNIPYEGKKYTFAMNGQTGTMRVDKLPTNSLYKMFRPAIFMLLYIIEFIIGFFVLRNDYQDTTDLIVSMVCCCLIVPTIFNYIIAYIIHYRLFRKTIYELETFDDQRYFDLYDFVD